MLEKNSSCKDLEKEQEFISFQSAAMQQSVYFMKITPLTYNR
jgi:hypothetical protein